MPGKAVKSPRAEAVHSKDGLSAYGDRLRTALRGRGFTVALALVALLAFGLRMAVSGDLLAHDPSVANPSSATDMWTYQDLAGRIVKGEIPKEFYYQPFYYAVFLPASHLVLGASIWAALIAQSLAGTGAAVFAGLSAAMLWGRRAGLLAALLATLSAALLIYTPYLLIETSQSLWLTLLLFLSLLAFKKGGAIRWGAVGLALSIAILTRGNAWIFLPGIIAACVWKELVLGGRPLRMALCLLALLVMTILPQTPFALRNTFAKGSLCGPSTAAGAVLALGNTPEAPPGGRNPGTGPGPMEYPPTYHVWMQDEAKESIPHRIIDWAEREPLAFLELQFRKALLFWDSREIPNNIAFEHNGAKSSIWRTVGIVPTGLLAALALAGIFAGASAWRRRPATALAAYFILAYWLATVAFYILARFKVPAIPLLCVMGAGFTWTALRQIATKDFHGLLVRQTAALALAVFVCYCAYDIYRFGFEAKVMGIVRPDGVKVETSSAETMLLDNGPESFGCWTPIKLDAGTRLVKSFKIPTGDFKAAKLEISGFWFSPGEATLSVNGISKTFSATRPGPMPLAFELQCPPDGRFIVEAVNVAGELSLGADLQRNYGRSALNGTPFDGELVARLRLQRKAATE